MGTRSDIIVKMKDGRWGKIYCHWDGYLSHNGELLAKHYNSQAKAESLIKLGDLSFLAEKTSKPKGHTFDNPVKGHCVAYGRDRGEKQTSATFGHTLEDVWPDEESWTEYHYVWDGTKWLVSWERFSWERSKGPDSLIELSQALADEAEKAA